MPNLDVLKAFDGDLRIRILLATLSDSRMFQFMNIFVNCMLDNINRPSPVLPPSSYSGITSLVDVINVNNVNT